MPKRHSMFRSRVKRRGGDVAADQDTSSLDFGRAINPPVQGNAELDNSITLWGPGVQIPETPSTILSESLQAWRKDNGKLPADKAAEELDKLYESLPSGALELTFQDMVGRNDSVKGKEQNGQSRTETSTIKEEDGVQVKPVAKSEKSQNSAKLSMASKIVAFFAPKMEYVPSNKEQVSAEGLDKLVEKQQKKIKGSEKEGLYSASTTPATSFRRVSPLGSPKLSPSGSFTDYMLKIDRHSFERELTRSARYLEAYIDDVGGKPRVDEEFRQRDLGPDSLSLGTSKGAPDEDNCSICPMTNLSIMKTTCLICGKSYCLTCRDTETKEALRGVRRCVKDCGGEQQDENNEGLIIKTDRDKRRANLWWLISFGSCMRVKEEA